MPNAECRMPNAECRMPNAECRMPNAGSDCGCGARQGGRVDGISAQFASNDQMDAGAVGSPGRWSEHRMFSRGLTFAAVLLVPSLVRAYVDMAPTLAAVVRDSERIAVVEVDKFTHERGLLTLRKVRDLKGETGAEAIKHALTATGESAVSYRIAEWAQPGRRGVMFASANSTLVCMGDGWYQVSASAGGWWKIAAPRPDLALAYCGSTGRLADAVAAMLAGKSAVITALPHGAEQEGASVDLALNRIANPALIRLQRMRVNLRMAQMAMAVSANPAYLVGPGRAGEEDLPALLSGLKSPDASIRAESADDLGSLGSKAQAAGDELTARLEDSSDAVKLSAASALLRIRGEHPRATAVLLAGLQHTDAGTRRAAARAVGFAGSAAAPCVAKLTALLADPDPTTRCAALQAIAGVGSAAAQAVAPVTKLLDDPATSVEAADALGRLGAAARPVPPALTKMLESPAYAQRWAAVRAMSQIGGPEAAPAVKFMMGELSRAPELDAYNMMIYLALLGPVAKDAVPSLRTARLKNPILRQAAAWAIEPDKSLPWTSPFGNADFARWIFESIVRETGDGLRPAAAPLARKIIEGTAGEVPTWAYRMLAKFPDDVLPILSSGFDSQELAVRQRATVAVGHMGTAAGSLKPRLAKAIADATGEKDRLLLKWCLRQIGG